MRKMLIILNHLLTPEQEKNASDEFGIDRFISMPDSLAEKWENVPPDMECLDEFLSPIFQWIDSSASQGDYAIIQGDFGSVYKCVSYCLKSGIIPVYSTTKRIAEEVKTDEGTKIIRIFRHVRFRKYS